MINENQVGEILSRRQRNESISQIARTMNLSRPTVRRYANMPEEQAQQARTHQKLNRCSILDEYRDQIEWNWDVGAEFRISIKKPELQGLRP